MRGEPLHVSVSDSNSSVGFPTLEDNFPLHQKGPLCPIYAPLWGGGSCHGVYHKSLGFRCRRTRDAV
jgi:hypothetical protein